jgi:hypothetical protein
MNAVWHRRELKPERLKLVKKASWCVRLGTLEWSRYTYSRPDDDPLRLLGSIRRGLQIGALALNEQGQYVQVVGDYITPLNTSQISRAVAKARCIEPVSAPRPAAPVRTVTAPVVTVKRRRVYVMTPSE